MLVLAYMGVLSLLLCPMQSAFPTRRPSFDSARNRHTNHQRCSRTPPLSRSTLLNPAPTASSNNSAVISSSNAAGVASIPLTLPTLFVRSDIFDKKVVNIPLLYALLVDLMFSSNRTCHLKTAKVKCRRA